MATEHKWTLEDRVHWLEQRVRQLEARLPAESTEPLPGGDLRLPAFVRLSQRKQRSAACQAGMAKMLRDLGIPKGMPTIGALELQEMMRARGGGGATVPDEYSSEILTRQMREE